MARRRRHLPWVALAIASVGLAGVAGEQVTRAAPLDTRSAPIDDAFPVALDEPAVRETDDTMEVLVRTEHGLELEHLLVRAGAETADAAAVAALFGTANADLPAGSSVSIFLGGGGSPGRPSVERVSVRPSLGTVLTAAKDPGGKWRLLTDQVAVTSTMRRVRGSAGDALYWSLRASGADADAAQQFVEAVDGDSAHPVDPGDRFELLFDRQKAADGKAGASVVQYAALQRIGGERIDLVRWIVDGRATLVNPRRRQALGGRLGLPIAGSVTSQFGMRVHPIFRTARLHRGIDIGARWGTPVHAPADGVVTTAGWSGGYGVRVRLAHDGGVATSYSHLAGTMRSIPWMLASCRRPRSADPSARFWSRG